MEKKKSNRKNSTTFSLNIWQINWSNTCLCRFRWPFYFSFRLIFLFSLNFINCKHRVFNSCFFFSFFLSILVYSNSNCFHWSHTSFFRGCRRCYSFLLEVSISLFCNNFSLFFFWKNITDTIVVWFNYFYFLHKYTRAQVQNTRCMTTSKKYFTKKCFFFFFCRSTAATETKNDVIHTNGGHDKRNFTHNYESCDFRFSVKLFQ